MWKTTLDKCLLKTRSYFKGLCTAFERSNQGYTWDWDEQELVGKLIGIMVGQEEFVNDLGEIKIATRCIGVRSIDAVRAGVKPPRLKTLNTPTADDQEDPDSEDGYVAEF